MKKTPAKGRTRPGIESVAARCEKVIELMSAEGLSAVKACERVGFNWGNFWRYSEANPEFRSKYARAREAVLERMSHEIHNISDTPVVGTITTTKPDGTVEVREADMIEHRKLQIDTRKWLLSKLVPKTYGDKQQLEHSGSLDIASALAAGRNRIAKPKP